MNKQKKWIFIGIALLCLFIFGKYNQAKNEKIKASQPKEFVKVEKPKTYREKFDEKNFDELRGGYKPVRNFLRKNIDDPSSLEVVNTWNNGMNEDSTFAIKTTFRAKNAYNATVINMMYCNLDINGNISKVRFE